MSIDTTAKLLMEAMRGKAGTSAYDTQATVTRVDGDTLWVHIPGGVDETPIQRTIDASEGDVVQVRVSNGNAFAMGNASAPPTDDTRANEAYAEANNAADLAAKAEASAATAAEAASAALESASTAATAATQAVADAATANTAAQSAQTSANSALTQLATVEDVVGTLNWIAEHGSYALTSDTDVVAGKLYFTRTGSGTDADPYVYSVVTNPTGAPATLGYYELDSVDEAVSNYVATHLALTDDGLYVIKDGNGWKVLIKNDGVYIIDTSGDVVAQYKDEVVIGRQDEGRVAIDFNSLEVQSATGVPIFMAGNMVDRDGTWEDTLTFTSTENPNPITYIDLPYLPTEIESVTVNGVDVEYSQRGQLVEIETPSADSVVRVVYRTDMPVYVMTFGLRAYNSTLGRNSATFGERNVASGYTSLAEGYDTSASEDYAHAEGYATLAKGKASHAQNRGTIATGNFQTAIGKYNVSDTTSALIIGNGTSDSARSNAMSVDWNGNEVLAGGLTINGSTDVGTELGNKVPTTRTVNGKALSSDISLSASDIGALGKRTKTVTGTTTAAGNISLGLSDSYGILSVHRTDANSICTPYVYNGTSNIWYAHLTNIAASPSAVASTSVTLEVDYYEK